jgi:hypothetical protein
MRYLTFLLSVLFIQVSFGQVRNIQAETKIREVIVFTEGAQVERIANVTIPAGRSEWVFSGISPQLEKQSIQVKTATGITVLSVNHQVNFLREQEIREDIRALEEKMQETEDKKDLEKSLVQVYKQEEAMLQKNQEIGGNNGIKTPDLKEALDFQRQKLTEVLQKQFESQKKVRHLEKEVQKIRQQLAEINQRKDRNTSEILVQVSADKTLPTEISIRYLVKKAGWVPTYDIRIKNVSSPIEVLHKANISQQSGEDWKEVKLILSTGNPREKGTKPDLQPWLLSYESMPFMIRGRNSLDGLISGRVIDEKGNPVVSASIFSKGNSMSAVTDVNGHFSIQQSSVNNTLVVSAAGMQTTEINTSQGFVNINMLHAATQLEEVVVNGYMKSDSYNGNDLPGKVFKVKRLDLPVQVSYQPITTQYEITMPYSIPNDGKVYTTEVMHYEAAAVFEYFSVPKIDPGVYLTAGITDWEGLNLMPGETNIFYEGAFLGKSFLDLSATGDTLSISLGQDKSITVNRKLIKEYSGKKFLGSTKVDSRFYQITVRNNKQEKINLTIADQFPVSTEKEIQVERGDTKGGKEDDKTGNVSWTFSLNPKEEIIKSIEYKVKYPKDKKLILN